MIRELWDAAVEHTWLCGMMQFWGAVVLGAAVACFAGWCFWKARTCEDGADRFIGSAASGFFLMVAVAVAANIALEGAAAWINPVGATVNAMLQ